MGTYNDSGIGRRSSYHSPVHVMALILLLFLVVRFIESAGHLPPLAASFADDLLCLPLVLGGVLWCHRQLSTRGPRYTMPRSHGLMTLALFSIYFEGLLPQWSSSATKDPWDLLMYLAGYLVFENLMNKPAIQTLEMSIDTRQPLQARRIIARIIQ